MLWRFLLLYRKINGKLVLVRAYSHRFTVKHYEMTVATHFPQGVISSCLFIGISARLGSLTAFFSACNCHAVILLDLSSRTKFRKCIPFPNAVPLMAEEVKIKQDILISCCSDFLGSFAWFDKDSSFFFIFFFNLNTAFLRFSLKGNLENCPMGCFPVKSFSHSGCRYHNFGKIFIKETF